MSLIALEAANHSRRNSRKKIMIFAAIISFLSGGLAIAFFYNGGRATIRATLQKMEHREPHKR